MSRNSTFFQSPRDQSVVKSKIVIKYFDAWSKIMLGNLRRHRKFDKICYIDLFSGPGKYNDGTKSTPVLILESAMKTENLPDYLYTIFNDIDQENTNSLIAEVKLLNEAEKFKFQPIITCSEIDDQIIPYLRKLGNNPKFTFLDPFGYAGISRQLIQYLIDDWGSDCLFFFNYDSINRALSNDAVRNHMNAIFGIARVEVMREEMTSMRPFQRETYILESLAKAIGEFGTRYVLPFRFRRTDVNRTSHALVFVTKHLRGYEIMKDIMARESSMAEEGVASFTYSQADENFPLLFALNQPLENLSSQILLHYQGKNLSMVDVYNHHHVGRKYIKSNYKSVLINLELEGKIQANPPCSARRKNKGNFTLADDVMISFPEIK